MDVWKTLEDGRANDEKLARGGKKLGKKENAAQNSIRCVKCHSMLNIGLFTSLNFKYLNLWTTGITFLAAQKY